ncbi:MAG: NUDIX hydrolase [Armatimonadetes bacterium]|nr:NUDIX hydrolase [Armatimonadota bacterium]
MKRSPEVGVGAVILRGREVLLVKRGHAPGKGLWSVPGGHLELNERLRECAQREAREETGLVVKAERLAGISEVIVPEEDGNEGFHFVLVDFFCRVISGELRPSGDADEVRWWPLERLSELPLTEGLAEKLHEWMDGAGAIVL